MVISAALTAIGWPVAAVWVFWVAQLKDSNTLLFGVFLQPNLTVPVVMLAVGAYVVTVMALFRLASEPALVGVQIGFTALGVVGVVLLVGFQFVTVIGKAMGAALGCAFGCQSANPGYHGEPAAVGTGTLLVVWLLVTLVCWIVALADVRKRSVRVN